MSTPESPTARPGLLVHLSSPMQSWGQRSRFGERDTAAVPTRSGLIGLIAAADGRPRDADLTDLRTLRFLIRVDRPGSLLRDFHTVGGGRPNHQTVATAEGKRRPGDTATLVTTRYYLQDAAFTVAVTTAPDPANSTDGTGLLAKVATALAEPTWPPFLGRRSCPPEATLLLGHHDNAWAALMQLPLHRALDKWNPVVDITYSADQPLDDLPVPEGCTPVGEQTTGSITDDPLSFAETRRAHTRRTSYQRVIKTPHTVTASAGIGTDYLDALTKHLNPEEAATGASR